MIEIAQLLGNFGEFFGSIAIVVTLLYLAKQIRENTKANRVMARQHFADQMAQMLDNLTEDQNLNELHGRGLTNPDSLNEKETHRLDQYLQKLFLFMSSQYYQHQVGAMDDETLYEVKVYINFYARQPAFRKWWPEMRSRFAPSSRNYVDTVISKEEVSTAHIHPFAKNSEVDSSST